VKGCWNKRLKKDLQEQLRDHYLAQSSCGHGLYLVGWFSCSQWDRSDSRKKRTPKMTPQKAQQFFEGQATSLSQEGLCVRALVRNTALR
jgi:hypothetical protein